MLKIGNSFKGNMMEFYSELTSRTCQMCISILQKSQLPTY